MTFDEPSWWYWQGTGWQARLLAPISAVYGHAGRRRMARPPVYRSKFPVLCCGNFTAGGTGKTPLALALADIVRELGREPVFLTRGYGGSIPGPEQIDAHGATAQDAGDEPLLLARNAPAVIARRREQGAELIDRQFGAASVIIMDDGFQNPALEKDFSIVVVDVNRMFGNGRCIPSGPLRAPLSAQLPRAKAILLNGRADAQQEHRARESLSGAFSGPVIRAEMAPSGDIKWLRNANVLAYAGIANPDRFFTLLEAQGARIVERRVFSDHHAFGNGEASALIEDAARLGARLVTTEKDFVRLYGATGARGGLRDNSLTLPVTLQFAGDGREQLMELVKDAIARRDAEQPERR